MCRRGNRVWAIARRPTRFFLAASVPARAGQSVLELGCGVGVASLCLAARVPGLALDGVELQGAYAALARRNATTNRVALTVTEADLRDLPCDLRNRSFDHVIANPPYYAANGPAAQDAGRDRALREDTPLAEWLDVGLRRVRDGGYLTIIHLTERLPDILAGIAGRASAVVLPLAARAGHPARRAIVQARKGARSPFMLLPPLVIHQGDHHPGRRRILHRCSARDHARSGRAGSDGDGARLRDCPGPRRIA